MAFLYLSGCGPATFVVGVTPGDQHLQATVVRRDGAWFADRVAIVDVSGMIYNASKPTLIGRGENPVGLLDERLEAAASDGRVKAVILRINSPGGTVTASDAMYRTIKRFKARSGKPVVALMMDVAASGGFYIACAADQIMAYPTAVTGSIGVMVQTVSFKPAMDRIGINAQAITSGPNKTVGSPLGTLTPEHRQILQSLVDDFYQRFVNIVREARPDITDQEFDRITDGRVVSGSVAARIGLIDRTGDLDDALKQAKKLANIVRADLVLYHRPLQYVGSPYAAASPPVTAAQSATPTTQINLAQINFSDPMAIPSTSFYYVWDP